MSLPDADLLRYTEHCVAVCATEFGRTVASLPPRFSLELSGEVPEYRQLAPGVSQITLQRDATPWQARYQAGHEIFHWLCTPPALFHWTHELLAVELALRCIRTSGIDDACLYVEGEVARLTREAEGVTLERMLKTPLVPPYPWVYGRAFLTGNELLAGVDWESLKALAVPTPDIRRWLELLPAHARAAALEVLGEPSDEWI